MLWAPGTLTPHQSPGHLLFSFCVPLSLRILFWSLRCLFFTCGYLIGCLTVQKAFQMVGSGGLPWVPKFAGISVGDRNVTSKWFQSPPFFLLLSGVRMLFSSHWVRPYSPPPRLKEACLCLKPTRSKASSLVTTLSATILDSEWFLVSTSPWHP